MNLQTPLILTLLISLTACGQKEKAGYAAAGKLNDGWEISEPGKEGFKQPELENLISNIADENPKINSLVIARHGKLIVDQYFNGNMADSLQKIWSVTKVITGTLLGIAADNRKLSEKDSIYKYLGDYISLMSPTAKAITIEHLITMTSGYEWVEMGGPGSAGFQLAYAHDWVEFTLKQPHTNAPGEKYNYSTGNTMVLGPILKNATGLHAIDYAHNNLFLPLGITHYEWDTQSEFWTRTQSGELPGAKLPDKIEYKIPFAEFTNTGSGLRMRPRDLCKFGQLYLNKGEWKGKRIVSGDWVSKSTSPHFGNVEYGYHWRLMEFEGRPCYYATGFGLQKIYNFPTLDLVVVMTQQHYRTMPGGEEWTNRFLKRLLETIEK
jgi:CubicO group peptidase (beta-lactamase class C family)